MKKMTSLSLSLGNGRPIVAIRERENLFIFMQFLEKGIPCFDSAFEKKKRKEKWLSNSLNENEPLVFEYFRGEGGGITSNHRTFGRPVISTVTNSQCYFVH